jgi:hypothetical protein
MAGVGADDRIQAETSSAVSGPRTMTIRFAHVVSETDDTFFAIGMFRYRFTATETGEVDHRPRGRADPLDGDRRRGGRRDHLREHLHRPAGERLDHRWPDTGSRRRHGNDHDDIRTRSEVREPIGEPLSEKVSFLHGPHPERESDFNLLCEEVVAYLLDP